MSKIVFFCIPAHGHTNPTLPVVRELTAMGHEVYYYSFREFQEKIEAAGAHFIGCDDYDLGMDASDTDRVAKDITFATELIVRAVLAMDETVTADMQKLKPDVIVGDSVAYWGKLTAMKLQIPFVSSTTTFAFNDASSKVMKPSLKELFKMILDMPKTAKILAPLREKGYPADNILSIVRNDNDTRTVVYTSRAFQPCAETFSDLYTFVGPVIREAAADIPKTRGKLVYISLGTVINRQPDFYRHCIDAFRNSDYEVILSVGADTDPASLGGLPPHIHVYSHVDQIAVLQKADVFLSHCGMNSVSESLYFGVPLVLYPLTNEQKGVAHRTAELGAGLMLPSEKAIRETVETVLQKPSYREKAQQIAESFRKCGGAKAAAEAILKAI